MDPSRQTVKLSAIKFDPKIYPRQKHDPALVQRYSACLDSIESRENFISVGQDLRIVDGRHRQLAYQTASPNGREITVWMYPVSTDDDLQDLAIELNSEHGWQLTDGDKRSMAVALYTRQNRVPQAEIAGRLRVGINKVNDWLSTILKREKEEREAKMWGMWLSCHDQQEIQTETGLSAGAVSEFLQKTSDSYCQKENELFRNFDPQVYTVWNFPKLTNETRVFGSIPQEVMDNLLYYFTKPFDVVFDPFGGGGMTIDRCQERLRRYYVSDLSPIPARQDEIRQWDITQGLPDDLPVPDLVFLDPPYWKQAAGKYSKKETDLGNVDLDRFLDVIAEITKAVKRKWNNSRPDGRLALIIGQWKNEGEYLDLPFLCYERIAKYLSLDVRIQVPYSTQVHGGNFVKMAKEKKELLYLTRDLMVFKQG